MMTPTDKARARLERLGKELHGVGRRYDRDLAKLLKLAASVADLTRQRRRLTRRLEMAEAALRSLLRQSRKKGATEAKAAAASPAPGGGLLDDPGTPWPATNQYAQEGG